MKINLDNYEAWMVDYIEGNLSADQQRELQEFLVFHPELQKELDAFNMTKLPVDTSVYYPNKEALKQPVGGGKIIAMGSWKRYAAAAAAVCTLFIGIRMFNGNNNNAIQPYAYQRPSIQLPNKTVTPIAQDKQVIPVKKIKSVQPLGDKNAVQFADDRQKENQQHNREINPIQEIQFAQSTGFHFTSEADIRDMINISEVETQDVQFASNTVYQNSTVISLNDNKTVVDWWLDAQAIGSEVEGVITEVKDTELNPFKRKASAQEGIKERSFKVPGVSYYSRQAN